MLVLMWMTVVSKVPDFVQNIAFNKLYGLNYVY